MVLSLSKNLLPSLIFLLFVAEALSQNIRFPNRDLEYEEGNSCQRDSRCLLITRCPISRRVRNAPQCFYNAGYYRRTPGVCCRNVVRPAIPPTLSPATIAPEAIEIDNLEGVGLPNDGSRANPPFIVNDVEQCQRGSRCLAWSRCPPSRRPRTRNARPCSYEGFSSRNRGVCCAYPRERVLSAEIPNFVPPSITMATTTLASLISSPNGDCGRSFSTSGFMVGGTTASPGVWPWMVAVTKVEQDGTFSVWCTGSLIDSTHVLTAAHCFDEDRDVSLYTLRIGNVDQRLGDAYNIRSLAIPDSYQTGRFYSDVAVLTLNRPVSTDFMPICLPNSVFRNFTGTGVTLAGWGSTSPGGPTSDLLQQLISMPVVSTYECDSIFRRRLSDFDTQFPNGINSDFICAGFLEGGRDSCGGDSGGPMMIPQGGRWYQIGIVSFGHARCATPGFPAGYTRVSSFIDFILGNL